jgi:ABC-type amino acid transport substrate-binding protein
VILRTLAGWTPASDRHLAWEDVVAKVLRKAHYLLVAAAGLLLAGAPSAADELTGTLKKVKDTGTVVLGYRETSIPFSYLNALKQPIGYAIDICQEIVDTIGREVGREDLKIAYRPVTPETRIPAVTSGEIDLECGSTTANAERRKQVDFSPIYYVSGTKLMIRRGSPIRSFRDLAGRKVVVTAGTTNEQAIRALVEQRFKIPATVLTRRDHAESFAALKEGAADALALDDVLLYGLIATAGPDGAKFMVLDQSLSYDPYGIMFRTNDAALAAVVKDTFVRLAESREIRWLYEKWFIKRLPTGERLNIPMSEELEGMLQVLGLPE